MYLPPSYLVFKTASCGRYNFLYEVEPPQEKGTFFLIKLVVSMIIISLYPMSLYSTWATGYQADGVNSNGTTLHFRTGN